MAVLIPRVRTIGVPLSEEEYSVRKSIRESSFPSALEHARQVRDLEQKGIGAQCRNIIAESRASAECVRMRM